MVDAFMILGGVAVAVLGLTVHEAAHALAADRLGDPTPRLTGRLTLNPVPHIDLFLTIILPGLLLISGSPFLFGGAKPVLVQPHYFRNPSRDMALVAAAGPLSNLVQAFLWALVLNLFLRFEIWDADARGIFILQIGITLNLVLMLFNLFPIPPLDGSRIVAHFLKGEARRSYMQLERFGIFILLGIIFFVPGFHTVLLGSLQWCGDLIADIAGVPAGVPWWPVVQGG
ncbi:MAG: site-2 protease family protein [Planctomycetota bacterium]|jgi:Zn-dependent protease